VGWAPQGPDEIYVEVRDNPRFWVFVDAPHFTSDRLWAEIEPGWHHPVFLQQTVIVNRTVVIRESDRTVAVNPGIEPTLIAREIGRPIPVYDVRPVVLAGTAKIEDAMEVRPDEKPRKIEEKLVERTDEVVKPAGTDETPAALAPNEPGRLGQRPPKAAGGEVRPSETKGAKKEADHDQAPNTAGAEEDQPDKKGKSVEQGESDHPNKGANEEGQSSTGKAAKDEKSKAADQPGKKGKSVEQGESDHPNKGANEEGQSRPA
jgi:hypothetical protein